MEPQASGGTFYRSAEIDDLYHKIFGLVLTNNIRPSLGTEISWNLILELDEDILQDRISSALSEMHPEIDV